MCDMMDSFNSDNVDRFSNIVAAKFAKDNDMPAIAGSDSHMLTTLGKCVNTIESEDNLDTIPQVMKRGQVRIAAQDYATKDEVYEHARYILHISRELLLEYALAYHPRAPTGPPSGPLTRTRGTPIPCYGGPSGLCTPSGQAGFREC
jgi:hypothetical protein